MNKYDFTNFTNIKVSGPFEIEVRPSETFDVAVTAPEKWFDHISAKLNGDTLEIKYGTPWAFWNWWGRGTPKVVIAMPDVYSLDFSGASKSSAEGFHSTHDFKLTLSGASSTSLDVEANFASIMVSGASRVNGQVKVNDTVINVSGASNATLNGSGNKINLQASGASRASLDTFKAVDARIELSGASHASASLAGKLDAFLSGASSLNYSGNATLGQVNVTGASTLKKG